MGGCKWICQESRRRRRRKDAAHAEDAVPAPVAEEAKTNSTFELSDEVAANEAAAGVCTGGNMCMRYTDPSSCSTSIFGCSWKASCIGYCSGDNMCDMPSQSA